ncbi:MAG: Fe(2+)-trafficking protein [Thermoanaerobaculia bacterium]
MEHLPQCVRCGRTEPRLEAPPLPGPAGQEVLDKICAGCWHEWTQAEVMVINELRLNFMDPKSLEILESHMREFLLLDGPAGPAT